MRLLEPCCFIRSKESTKITIKTGGGGGFGPPAKRSKDALNKDKIQGYTN